MVMVGVLVIGPIGALRPLTPDNDAHPAVPRVAPAAGDDDAQCEAPRSLASLTYVEAAIARPDVKDGVLVGNDFLTASAEAATRLQVAQRKHATLKAKADRRMHAAQDRHAADLSEAAAVEAAGWRQLLEVPGMTVVTAARIGGTSESTVGRWLARAKEPSCT
jgi:hypothetical protein